MLKSAVFISSMLLLMPWVIPLHIPATFLLGGVSLFEDQPVWKKLFFASLLITYAILLYRIDVRYIFNIHVEKTRLFYTDTSRSLFISEKIMFDILKFMNY